jgi:hypothetical protein
MPKYTSKVPYQHRRHYPVVDTMVVVEDWLSALQCFLSGYDALALFTTTAREAAVASTVKHGYDRVLIALDNDNSAVRANQRRLMRSFSVHFDDVRIKRLQNDPKEYTIEHLKEVLE